VSNKQGSLLRTAVSVTSLCYRRVVDYETIGLLTWRMCHGKIACDQNFITLDLLLTALKQAKPVVSVLVCVCVCMCVCVCVCS